MVDGVVIKLLQSFPRSFINQHGEFIAHDKANEYFILKSCKDETEIYCKVLEWFSRGACKTEPFRQRKKNEEFNSFMLNGINNFLDTKFTHEDMIQIYTKLGNSVNRKLCEEFILSHYNMVLLNQ